MAKELPFQEQVSTTAIIT